MVSKKKPELSKCCRLHGSACAIARCSCACSFRRSELVSLDVQDVEVSAAGLIVTLRRSKTDQEGASRRLGIPFGSSEATCPMRALQAWLETGRIIDGPIFRPLDRFQRVQPTRCRPNAWR